MVSLSLGISMIWAMGDGAEYRYQRSTRLRREEFFGGKFLVDSRLLGKEVARPAVGLMAGIG
jgi:hypothetical protein